MKHKRCWRSVISLLCVTALFFGLSVEAATTTWAHGPFVFLSKDNFLILTEYDSTKDSTQEVCVHNWYATEEGKLHYVVGIQKETFQGASLDSLLVEVEGEYDISAYGYGIGDCAFSQAEIGISSSNPQAYFRGGTITAIGSRAFEGAKIGCDLVFDSVNGSISSYAFKDIEVKGGLKIYGKLERLGEYALAGARMESLVIPEEIKEIESGAFQDTKIKSWEMPDALQKLGSNIFEGCVLESITLPSSDREREIAGDAFPDQTGLTIMIPEGLTDLSVFHLDNYKNLVFQTAPSLPEDSPVITYLREKRLTYRVGETGEWIIPDDTSEMTPGPTEEPTTEPTEEPTKEPTIEPTKQPTAEPTKQPTIEPTKQPTEEPTEEPTREPTKEPTLVPTGNPTVVATASPTPKGITDPTASPAPVQKEEKKNKADVVKNLKYKMKNANAVVVTGTTKKALKKLQIPDTVKIRGRLYKVEGIQKKAFQKQKKLKTVVVGNYVRDVGDEAFANCPQLGKIQLGTGVRRLGKKVLYNDRKLKKIIFKGTKLKKIGKKTFYGVPRQVDIRAVRSKVKSYARLINRTKK